MRISKLIFLSYTKIKRIARYLSDKLTYFLFKIVSIFSIIITSFKTELFPILYFYCIFVTIWELKINYINHFSNKLIFTGYIKSFQLLNLKNENIYLAIIIFISLIIICYFRGKKVSPYKFTVISYIIFNLMGLFILFIDFFEVLSLLFFLLYGGLVSIILGMRVLPYRPKWMDQSDLKKSIKIELIKTHISNWWKGLTILTSILIALFISALVSWVLNPTPVDLKIFEDFSLKLSFYLFFSALPGLIYIYIRIIKQINYTENLLLEM